MEQEKKGFQTTYMRTRYPANFLPTADPAFLLKEEERPLALFPQHLQSYALL